MATYVLGDVTAGLILVCGSRATPEKNCFSHQWFEAVILRIQPTEKWRVRKNGMGNSDLECGAGPVLHRQYHTVLQQTP